MSVPEYLWSIDSPIVRTNGQHDVLPSPILNTTCRGGALERGFRRVMNNVPIGSLLVQTNSKTGEPLLLHVMLPRCIRERHRAETSWVFLLDAQVSSVHCLCSIYAPKRA